MDMQSHRGGHVEVKATATATNYSGAGTSQKRDTPADGMPVDNDERGTGRKRDIPADGMPVDHDYVQEKDGNLTASDPVYYPVGD